MITYLAPGRYAVTCDATGCERILLTDAGWAQEAKAAARANGWDNTTECGSAVLPRQYCPEHRGTK